MSEFVHCHCHSEYSLLDGLSSVKAMVARAKQLGQPAIALTDHGAMYGTLPFYQECLKEGIKPIIGLEAYLALNKITDKDRKRFHMLLLAKDNEGYHNLIQLASKAQLQGFYYKPRIDHDLLAQHSGGLIATTGCMAAEIPQAILSNDLDRAYELMGLYLDIFGKDNLFIELQEHSIPELTEVNRQLIAMAPEFDLSSNFLATNDTHYTYPQEAIPHDILLCIQTNQKVTNPKRMRFSDQGYYIKSYDEMDKLFGDIPGALSNSLRIAEMCNVTLDMDTYHLPNFNTEGIEPASMLSNLASKGLKAKMGANIPQNYIKRLESELGVIQRMGFDTYFLIVWDLCQWASRSDKWYEKHDDPHPYNSYQEWKDNDIWYNVRGSGAGSLVAYVLGITSLDPIEHGLIFERFLNPSRISMPDIDLDFPDNQRHEMVVYTQRRYGIENVAQIITFGRMKARAAMKDVARVTNWPYIESEYISSLVPAIPGKPVKIRDVMSPGHEFYSETFMERYEEDEETRELVETAIAVEGTIRHASTHAAGIIVTPKPVDHYVPLNRTTGKGIGLDRVSQWDMESVESMGLLKLDYLGISTLTAMRLCCKLVAARHGVNLHIDTIPYDNNKAIFDLLSRGKVAGIFQVEGAGMKRLMMEMNPDRFSHIVAALSLYRPGPMGYIDDYIKRMRNPGLVTYKHPKLEPILGETYGIIVYQEQLIRMAVELAGYTPGEADKIRKAVGKKKENELRVHKDKFINGGVKNGINEEIMSDIWEDILFFARYGFNKSHASDYAKITCQTAYLKALYPLEYMTAILIAESGKPDKIRNYITECRRMGINVLPPHINKSSVDFQIEGGDIRFGLGAIKGVGKKAIAKILKSKPYQDIYDFCHNVRLKSIGKVAMVALIKAGAFDEPREQLLEAYDRLVDYSGRSASTRKSGQLSLFPATLATETLLNNVPQLTNRELLDFERDTIGTYITALPVPLEAMNHITHRIDDLPAYENETVVIAGLITQLREHITKHGDPMAFIKVDDGSGETDIVLFPDLWDIIKHFVKVDNTVYIKGRVQVRQDEPGIVADNIQQIDRPIHNPLQSIPPKPTTFVNTY